MNLSPPMNPENIVEEETALQEVIAAVAAT